VRCSDAFDEIGPGALQHLKDVVNDVEAFLDLLADPKISYLGKLMDHAKARDDVAEFRRFYARWLGSPSAQRLKAEVYQLLEEALRWWHGRMAYGEVEE